MDITINEFLRRKRAVQNHQIRSDFLAATVKNQHERASKSPDTHFSGKESSPDLSSCAVNVGVKRKRNEYGEFCNTANRSKSEDVIASLSEDGGEGEETGSGNQFHEIDLCKDSFPDAQVGAAVEISQNLEADKSSEVSVQQKKTSDCASLKFNDFNKMREEVNFAVGQAWALYDTADGMPRLYALIKKVSAPSLGLRITYLEPDPADEKEIQWCEEDLPVSAGNFRLGKNQNTKDRTIFSHVIQCNEGINTRHFSGTYLYFTVTPRKGETWALFKNWDIKWSSEPDSHRKYEYEFVEILSDYADEAGVFVAYLHKAKGFASVFFRTGTGNADIFRILPRSLYRFSHRVPSFKLTGIEGKGLPKDAYELDQAALPETIQEITVPSNSESIISSKRQAIYFASKGKVFQTGQIWSFYSGCDDLALYYGRIQKITFTQAFKQVAELKLHISRLKTTPFPADVINWEDRTMPVGCGTFYARKVVEIISPSAVSHQIMPQISMDGNEYTILPKIGEIWLIYRYWSRCIDVEDLDFGLYDIVEVLDDALDYKVQLLEHESVYGEDEYSNVLFRACKEYKYNEVEGSEPIFTIPKSERLRFSNSVPALRVTKEICGELEDLIEVDFRALPINVVDL